MNKNKIEYVISESASNFIKVIQTETNSNIFKKQYNLSGDYSNENGINLFPAASLFMFRPSFGPVVSLSLKCVNINRSGSDSKIILSRSNGMTYKFHVWFAAIFFFVTLLISFNQFNEKGISDNLNILFLPSFGIIYILFIEIIAAITYKNLVSKIETLLKNHKIRFKKQ